MRPAGARAQGGRRPVRFAVVGLGHFAQSAVLPAFAHAKGVQLAALVSEEPRKLRALGRRYGVEHLVAMEDYQDFLRSGAVDAVYLVVPNDKHKEYALQAARAGVHVLTEKPMALSSHDCRKMIRACDRAGVRLMVAYRLHFEPANLAAIGVVQGGRIGEPRFFSSNFTMQVRAGNIRTQAKRGGGPLWDIGIYCLNAARYLFQAEPRSVVAEAASSRDARFAEVDEMVSAILRFPGQRLATFTCSFGAADLAQYTVAGTKGVLHVEPAYEHSTGLALQVEGPRKSSRRFPKVDQVAPELEHFADCIRTGKDPEPSGKEGLIDIATIEAIQAAILTGKRQWIHAPRRQRRPTRRQESRAPSHEVPDLVKVSAPSR